MSADVLSLVLRESLAITAVGLTVGLGLAMLIGWGLRAAIYQRPGGLLKRELPRETGVIC